jgi:hypothetical protein
MRQLFQRRSATALVLGVTALAIAAAGGAYAASSGGGAITVCVSHKGGTLYKAKKCKRHDKKLSWNKQGPAGKNGTNGTNGANGAVAGYSASAAGNVTFTTSTPASPKTILSLSLPAGSFMVSAKTVASAGTSSTAGAEAVTCHLAGGGATDEADTVVPYNTNTGFTAQQTLAMSLPVTLSAAGSVTLSCSQGPGSNSTDTTASQSDINAVQTTANH